MSRHLVLGANGYVGSHLVRALASRGHEVIACGRMPQSVYGVAEYHSVDLTDRAAAERLSFDVDLVWNFAARTGTAAGFEQPDSFIRDNDLVLLNVLGAIKAQASRPRVVFPSTRLVYRGSSDMLTESSEQASLTVYAQSKRSCESYLAMYANAFEIPSTVFRLGVLFGSADESSYSYSTIGAMLARARQQLPLMVFGDGSQRRTFTHIDDATSDMIAAATCDQSLSETYNVGGETLSVADVATLIAAKFGLDVTHAEWPELHRRIESGDTVFDSAKLDARLGARPRTRMCEWLSRLA